LGAETPTSPASDRDVFIEGLRLHTRRRRGHARPPLVLVQGIGATLEAWAPLLAALPGRDVVMIDGPGAGESDVPRRPLRMPAIADCIAAAVRAQGIERADVLGFSLGGLVVQELARRHPALVRRLILVSTTIGGGGESGSWRVKRTLFSTKRYRDPARAARDIPLLAGGRTARDPQALSAMLSSRESRPPSRRGYRYQQWAVLGWSSRRWLQQLRVPTLVLHGDDDPTVPFSNARTLASLIPGARLEIIPGAGHLLLFDEAGTAARIVEHFLAD
jgi:poly(3-hydroxyoctanoate) depolymerase